MSQKYDYINQRLSRKLIYKISNVDLSPLKKKEKSGREHRQSLFLIYVIETTFKKKLSRLKMKNFFFFLQTFILKKMKQFRLLFKIPSIEKERVKFGSFFLLKS